MTLLNHFKLNTTWMKPLPAPFRQPQTIAVLLSLGFHGVLFGAGPSFSSLQGVAPGSMGFDQGERRVPLIELSPEEQNRLPDFSSSSFSLGRGDNSDFWELIPPSGQAPSSLPLNPNSSFGALPDLSIAKPPFTGSPFLPSPLGGPLTIPLPPRQPASSAANGSAPPRPSAATNPSEAAARNGNPQSTNGSQPSAADLELSRGNGSSSRNGGTPNVNNNHEGGATRSQELIARLEYNAEQTTTAEAETAQANWVAAIQEALGQQPLTQVDVPLTVEVPYDWRICLTPEPTEGLLGLAILPGQQPNTISLSTTVLQSTGYGFLNQTAEKRLQAQMAASDVALEIGRLYRAIVKVTYDREQCTNRDALLKSRQRQSEATPRAGE